VKKYFYSHFRLRVTFVGESGLWKIFNIRFGSPKKLVQKTVFVCLCVDGVGGKQLDLFCRQP